MRLFQNSGLYPSYLSQMNRLARGASTFEARRSVFPADWFRPMLHRGRWRR